MTAHPIQPKYSEIRARAGYPQPPAEHLGKKKFRDSMVTTRGNEEKDTLQKSLDTSCTGRPSSRSSLARGGYQQRQILVVCARALLQTNHN
ncbi:MAG TPA: hypothetical protein VN902_16840 [Candidatus Acidoferrales bacterium]|nr:hypothetical protein [Candidatus Acidoferrales bacterium]